MQNFESMITAKNVDLSNCDREQIQYSGAIQPHGLMLVIREPELVIVQASANAANLLGFGNEQVLGRNLRDLLNQDQLGSIEQKLQAERLDTCPLHCGRAKFADREFDIFVHRIDGVLVLELEVRPETGEQPVATWYSDLRGAMSRLQATNSLQEFFDLAADQIRAFTQFDRVMVYKFLEDGSGWVRSESLVDGLEPYLGLHFPPSDIPAPARRLFSLTWLRHQPDINYKPVPLVPENNPVNGAPLDLSYAFLRSVSVMYVDYLKNMGTQSSMVMTLLKDGKLWGLIACHHHRAPKHVTYEARMACEFIAHMVSLLMSAKEDMEHLEYRMRLDSVQAALVDRTSRSPQFLTGFVDGSPNLLDFVRADGAVLVQDGAWCKLGTTPPDARILQIVKRLASLMTDPVFATSCISEHIPETVDIAATASGVLAVRLSSNSNDFLLWFRREQEQTVNWAGDPNKPVDINEDGALRPRNSFALWKQTVQRKSTPWLDVEVKAARDLRAALLELVLRRAEELGRLYADLERSHSELDSFAYVASHDLKEPLRGIHNYAEMLREDYAEKLDAEAKSRLLALSRLSQRMDELLDSLLEYSRLGRVQFERADVDTRQTVQEALEFLHARVVSDNVQISVAENLPVVKGDYMRLVEVFANLITNAIKYNTQTRKVIEIGVENTADHPTFFVRDNGIGIQKEHQDQIFHIFRRLHARDEFGGGSGAGLTITKRIIERHGGHIWVESEANKGTTFRFTFGAQSAGAGA